MYIFNDELRNASEQIERKKHLEAVKAELTNQRDQLTVKADEAKNQMDSEKADVDKLEGRTLAAFFASVSGKKEEKLQKERAEAYAAAARYESICFELDSVKSRIDEVSRELSFLSGCENKYKRIYAILLESVKNSGSPDAERIFALESELSEIKARKNEISEALNEGKRAYELAEEAHGYLKRARNWNTFDLIGGGGMFTHFEKHDLLDSAQNSVEFLQAQLLRFKSELADVNINADINVKIDGFMRFADYFFDGIFADLAVGDRIDEGMSRINDAKNEILRAINKLEEMERKALKSEKQVSDSIKAIVEIAEVK